MNLFTPTSAVVMGGLALAKVGYGTYLRFLAPLLAVLLVLITAFLAVGAALMRDNRMETETPFQILGGD